MQINFKQSQNKQNFKQIEIDFISLQIHKDIYVLLIFDFILYIKVITKDK